MPKLHYSNRLDRLIGPLAQNLELEDPFEKAEIVVPNFSLQKWISLQLAQRVGIAVNLRFLPLEKACLLYTSPSPRDLSTSRMPSSA